MKKIIIVVAFLVLCFAQSTTAQEYKTEVELIESIIGKAKKDFISDIITIPTESSSEFWGLYNAYEEKREELARKRVVLIAEYVALFSKETNDEEGKFMNEVFKLRRQSEKNLKSFYKKIAKNVSVTTAMQFFQLEEYIKNGVNKGLYDNLPLKTNTTLMGNDK